MKKLLIVTMMVALASNALAYTNDIDISGLSEKQIAELKVKAAEVKEANKISIPTVDKASQWVEVGKNAGLALASCAKEVGVAGDTFLNSFTGKVVFGVLIFKMMAQPILHLFAGIILITIFVPIHIYMYKRGIEERVKLNDAGKVAERIYDTPSGEYQFGYFVGLVGIIGASIIVIITG